MSREITVVTTDPLPDESKTVEIKETLPITTTQRTTVRQLKAEHAAALINIENLKTSADSIVDQIVEIDEQTNLKVTDIPDKIGE